jgi:hypothetical protein
MRARAKPTPQSTCPTQELLINPSIGQRGPRVEAASHAAKSNERRRPLQSDVTFGAKPDPGYSGGPLIVSPHTSNRWFSAVGSASRSGEARTRSMHECDAPTYVEKPSISEATIHAWSLGHQ